MFRKLGLLICGVVLVACFMSCFTVQAGSPPLIVQRGGTGIDTITEGQSIWGSEINAMIATSSMAMNMDTGAVTIGEIVINAVADGDLIVQGDVGIGTTTPAENIVVTSTATTTVFVESTGSSGGNIILQDSDGAGCSEIYILDGTIVSASITCPY